MSEEWRPVVGFPDYIVSNMGRVMRSRPDAKGHKPRVLKPWLGNHQYQTVTVVADGVQCRRLVHRLVCEAFHGPAPSADHVVAHFDGSRDNNRAENLRWASRSENAQDALRHGTLPVGEKHWARRKPQKVLRGQNHGQARLGPDEVRQIRLAEGGVGLGRELAERFGVSASTVCKIRQRKLWAHVA